MTDYRYKFCYGSPDNLIGPLTKLYLTEITAVIGYYDNGLRMVANIHSCLNTKGDLAKRLLKLEHGDHLHPTENHGCNYIPMSRS